MNAGPVSKRRSAFADRLLEYRDFVFSDGAEFQRSGAWREVFGNRIGPGFDGRIIFEIGCGDAALLTRAAAKFPEIAFIGIDWKCRALHAGAAQIQAGSLRNVALLHGRAQDVRRMFADGELHEMWLFHPDPCDKPTELRNRLVAEPFLLDVHRVLHDGGKFVLKTDHSGYYQWMLGVLNLQTIVERFETLGSSADFWNDDTARRRSAEFAFAGELTGFEARFVKKRLPIYYVELRKRSQNEPRA